MSDTEDLTPKDTKPGSVRSRQVASQAFKDFIAGNWAARNDPPTQPCGAAPYLDARHQKLGYQFIGERLVIPAGNYKVRSNDTDYRFRAHSAFAHLTGLGGELEADAVLLLEPIRDQKGIRILEIGSEMPSHEAYLFFRPQAPRDSEEFYADSTYGEFWVGPRLTLEQMQILTGINTRPLADLTEALADDIAFTPMRIIRGVDAGVEEKVDYLRLALGENDKDTLLKRDSALDQATSTLRLCKDAFEISELQRAVDATFGGFEKIIAQLPRATAHPRGERVVEGAFHAHAREEGNGLGYDTIAASGNHANTLHWIDNDGQVKAGDMILVDAGIEMDSLYTADITRTLPVNGKFNETQAKIYQAVLDACEAGLHQARQPGCLFRDVHDAAVKVLVEHLADWGLLPCSVEEALSEEGQQWRRWMPHGVSHHLGMDVHDCAKASREMYLDAKLEPGMCFTIEPGLYFHQDDQLLPPEFRGQGVRIEDDVIVDLDGTVRRLSEDIPRTITAVENWMAEVQNR